MTNRTEGEEFFARAAEALGERTGLRLDPGVRGRLARCVTEEADLASLDLRGYVDALASSSDLLQDLIDRVTVQETSFFRDAKQFEVLREHVLPTRTEPVTIWSAGCSNGQEPYSLAMTIEESPISAWRVVATDLSRPALGRAERGRYTAREMAGVSPERRKRHFTRVGDHYEVTPSLRDRVTIFQHNLVTDQPPFERGGIDVVFCRNVLIYVGPEEILRFLDQVEGWLAPDGWLFLGFSESLWQVSDRFELVRVDESFIYRPRGRSGPSGSRHLKPVPKQSNERPRRKESPARSSPTPRRSQPGEMPSAASVAELLALGEAALDVGDVSGAIAAFRKSAYLAPDLPITHLHLGIALERASEEAAARRAYNASRAALDRADAAALETMLEGYQIDDLVRLIESKVQAHGGEIR